MVHPNRNGTTGYHTRVKNVAKLSEALHERLNGYALAAGAAGVALLACSPSAEAAPVCKNLSITLHSNDTYALRPANQTFPPFQIAQTDSRYLSSTYNRFYSWNRAFFTPNTAGANVLLGPESLAANLAAGASIGPGGQFGKPGSYGMLFTYGKGFRFNGAKGGGTLLKHRGNFDLQQANYVGFDFSQSGQVYYGWVRLRVTFEKGYAGHKYTILHILGYGYESTPNTAIAAGSCTASASGGTSDGTLHDPPMHDAIAGESAPHARPSAALGMLALGSDGLLLWRKQE
jgi:hypothetical protein